MDLPFPTDVREFDGDDRISFSRLDNKFIAVHDDGTEFEFDTDLKRWVPAEEESPDHGQHGHAQEQDSSTRASQAGTRKRGLEADNGSKGSSQTPPSRPNKKQKAPPRPRENTAVYVTGLPLDATVSEVHDLFSRKAGVIAEEIDSGAPRIKLYSDESGNFKGDALIVFFKPQSVEMAIMLLDDTDFRVTATGTREGRMRVQAADSSYKKVRYEEDGTPGGGNNNNNNGSGQEDKRPPRSDRDRQKIIKKTQKLDAKLADWDDDDDAYPATAQSSSKRDKTVILRRMFTLEELDEDPAALLEIKEDIRDECAKLGTVTSVVLYDQEVDGVVSVRFKDADSAAACIRLMHGRSFDGRVVEASLKTGREKFKKSDTDTSQDRDSD
ncbi:RNA recognition motif family protein [Metarhizium album ARSEF 1941]|uniref:RNA recognition motif family protein n=1 Tax=Metarhizium album (strain ARSEF 1941) TaxID=1081103 RepID=A0A0B2X3K3_METAS|nr:RNA recognition motif family protein [Metarhizium album ARSEF 1941]KHN99890.1 RNA recognition motif family protein [Metarhizium album ARSEF 1941]